MPLSEKHEEFLRGYAERMGPIWTGALIAKQAAPIKAARVDDAEPMRRQVVYRKDAKAITTYVVPPLPWWIEEGNCVKASREDREDFFAAENSTIENNLVNNKRAYLWQTYCHDCPVRNECFDWGLAYEEWGIWAGTTEVDRVRARKDKELREYGKMRVAAGYQPYKGFTCSDCGSGVRWKGGRCNPCAAAFAQKKRKIIKSQLKAEGYRKNELVYRTNLAMAEARKKMWERRKGSVVKLAVQRAEKEVQKWKEKLGE